MTKLKSLIILLIAVLGAYFIYNHFDKEEENIAEVDKFSSEYDLVNPNNVFKYSTLDEIIDVLENKTGFVFFCTPESEWCNYYAKYLNDILVSSDVIYPVYYYNLRNDRTLNTVKYQKVVSIIEPYLVKDDESNAKIYMPDLTVVKDGNIIAHNNDTSLIESDQNGKEYWTQYKIDEFRTYIISYLDLINKED